MDIKEFEKKLKNGDLTIGETLWIGDYEFEVKNCTLGRKLANRG